MMGLNKIKKTQNSYLTSCRLFSPLVEQYQCSINKSIECKFDSVDFSHPLVWSALDLSCPGNLA